MIRSVIFDMDGLIVDSEPWWRAAETNVFGKLSKAPAAEEFEMMMGRQIKEVIIHWYNQQPWENFDLEKTKEAIVDEVERLVKQNAKLLPGVEKIIQFFSDKNIPIALASSSPLKLITNLMNHFGLTEKFLFLNSAENELRGKPFPDVFLTTAKMLDVNPENCLVLEDSYNGLLAAKAADMKCIVVPAKEHFTQERFDLADLKLESLEMFGEEQWKILSQ
jgi:HAD superfamily hydrolase (TIGR01509 family)